MQPIQIAQAQAQIDKDEIDHERYNAKKRDVEQKVKEMLLRGHKDQLDKYMQRYTCTCWAEWASVQWLEGGNFRPAIQAVAFYFEEANYTDISEVASNLVEAFNIDAMIEEEEQNND